MRKRFYGLVGLVLVVVLAFGGCRKGQPTLSSSDVWQVVVSIAPQQYFVERVGGERVKVTVLVPPGAEPHTFEPKPEQLKAVSQAGAYLRIRIDFEDAWMDKIEATNPRMLMVDTTEGIQRLPMVAQGEAGEPQPAEEDENLDPHIWLSPSLVKVQAQTIYNTLVQLDPAHQTEYQVNLEHFLADINTLDQEIRQGLEPLKTRKFIVFHPAWGYFARDYGLTMVPIEVGGQEPSAVELAQLIAEAKRGNIRVVFAEPQFSQQAAQTIAKEIGGEVLLIDPLSPDWLDNLRQVSETFARVLSQRQTLLPKARIGVYALIPAWGWPHHHEPTAR